MGDAAVSYGPDVVGPTVAGAPVADLHLKE